MQLFQGDICHRYWQFLFIVEAGVAVDEDMEDEKVRAMRILQSVVGIKGVKAISKQEKAKKKFKYVTCSFIL